jgi:hypothetical protein
MNVSTSFEREKSYVTIASFAIEILTCAGYGHAGQAGNVIVNVVPP